MNRPLPISSPDCEFLSLLEEHKTISSLCESLRLDKGFVSRKVSKIAARAPVLERVEGKWRLTARGERIVAWFREASERQRTILGPERTLRIATTQVVSERRLLPILRTIRKEMGLERIEITTSGSGVEGLLLARSVDCALVCGIPKSPEIRYKKAFRSPFEIAYPSGWGSAVSNSTVRDLLEKRPYVEHPGIRIREMLGIETEVPPAVAELDHLVGVRAAVVEGVGWSILPSYSIENEKREKKIRVLQRSPELDRSEEFQLWWAPTRWPRSEMIRLVALIAR